MLASKNGEVSGIAAQIRLDSDKYQPLRERGTSRTHINGRLGHGIVGEEARSVEGRFSILVFRNILFKSDYLHSHIPIEEKKVYFRSVTEFFHHMRRMQHFYPNKTAEAFFCNKKALSQQTIGERSIHNARYFWDLASCDSWDDLVKRDGLPKFSELQGLLSSYNTRSSKIPGFGPLSCFLTALDLAYAGVAQLPSPEETAREVQKLKSGAASGLALLHLIPDPATRSDRESSIKVQGKRVRSVSRSAQSYEDSLDHAESVESAFIQFYTDVSAALSEEEKCDMGWNAAVAEHTLCKIKRFRHILHLV